MMKLLSTSGYHISRQFRLNVHGPSFRLCSTKPAADLNEREGIKPNLDDIDQMLKERQEDLPSPDVANPYERETKLCILCKYNVQLDYKNTKLLSQFISPHTGQVYNKNITGLCTKQHERVILVTQQSRRSGYMPYVHKDVNYLRDTQLIGSLHTPIKRH